MSKLNEIKRKRLEAGLTQQELCNIVKTSPKKIVSIERGEIGNTTLDLMKRIAVTLNSTVEELFLSK
ncbi:helix-turn-helix domain-containing protein [Clostridium sp. VAP51]|uniref:helix-turn-helix transcriptional regulator n=1 Tax=Clostridium sp. VAP51 TaxID=2949978 RepID=UPI00207979BA|nr:helix-turn-helix domain-containing protein [Clostridium sp. VAP51]